MQTSKQSEVAERRRVLLIDAQEPRVQRLGKRLRLRGFDTETADSFLYALTKLEWQRPHLMVVRAEPIDGMSSEEFGTTISLDPALRAIPTILISPRSHRAPSAVMQYDRVIDDDDDSDRLASKVASLAQACLQPRRVAPVEGAPMALESDLSPIGRPLTQFARLLEKLNIELESGRVVLRAPESTRPMFVVLDHGHIVHAVFGGLEGAPAFRRMIGALRADAELDCAFETLPRWQISVYPRSIGQAERESLLNLASGQGDYTTQELDGRLELD